MKKPLGTEANGKVHLLVFNYICNSSVKTASSWYCRKHQANSHGIVYIQKEAPRNPLDLIEVQKYFKIAVHNLQCSIAKQDLFVVVTKVYLCSFLLIFLNKSSLQFFFSFSLFVLQFFCSFSLELELQSWIISTRWSRTPKEWNRFSCLIAW